MQQLLSHTAGFSTDVHLGPRRQALPDDKLLSSKDLKRVHREALEIALRYEPGNRWHYSVAVDVTGAVIERVSGSARPLPEGTRLRSPQDAPTPLRGFRGEARASAPIIAGTPRSESSKFCRSRITLPTATRRSSRGAAGSSRPRWIHALRDMLPQRRRARGRAPAVAKTIELDDHEPPARDPEGREQRRDADGEHRRLAGSGFGLGSRFSPTCPAAAPSGRPANTVGAGAAGTTFWVDPVERHRWWR